MHSYTRKHRLWALALSASLVGAAVYAGMPVANAATIDPAAPHVFARTYRLPGEVVHVESITLGTPASNAVRFVRLNPAEAQALEARALQQVRAMQAQMQYQMRWMQNLMATAFAQPGFPFAVPPLSVAWTLPPIEMIPVPSSPTPQVGPHSAPPIPISDVPGHQMVRCRWNASVPVHTGSRTAI